MRQDPKSILQRIIGANKPNSDDAGGKVASDTRSAAPDPRRGSRQLWGENFALVDNGLDPNHVVQFVEDLLTRYKRLDERGGHEMLFAQRAVLCEGKDDVFATHMYLEKLNVDLDGRSISIIRAGDVGAIPAYAEMAKKLGIPWCAITNEDSEPDGSIKKTTETVRQKLDDLKTMNDRSIVWKTDLEACLGKAHGKATPEWITREIEPKSVDQIREAHPDFATVGQAVEEWLDSDHNGRWIQT